MSQGSAWRTRPNDAASMTISSTAPWRNGCTTKEMVQRFMSRAQALLHSWQSMHGFPVRGRHPVSTTRLSARSCDMFGFLGRQRRPLAARCPGTIVLEHS